VQKRKKTKDKQQGLAVYEDTHEDLRLTEILLGALQTERDSLVLEVKKTPSQKHVLEEGRDY
jgi:hypothetical protein